MRAKEARLISIGAFLKSEGFHPTSIRQDGKELWYSSPIRSGDETPSFKVDTVKNLWYDFGLGKGGNALDLVCELKNMNIKEALAFLDGSSLLRSPYLQTALPNSTPSRKNLPASEKEKLALREKGGFEVLEVSPIKHKGLLDFLQDRKIALPVAQNYLSQVHFRPKGKAKAYYGLGWPCGDGFEVRNKFFKGFVASHKDFIELNLKNGNSLSIFEGFMDFLAFLSFYKRDHFENSVIILNTINLKQKALERIKAYHFSKIYLFLDNDEGGTVCKQFFLENIKDTPITDKSALYSGFNDFNHMTMEQTK